MPVAAVGPLLVTVMVKVTLWPRVGLAGATDLVIARSVTGVPWRAMVWARWPSLLWWCSRRAPSDPLVVMLAVFQVTGSVAPLRSVARLVPPKSRPGAP